jgi:ABC-type multidrug transport system fused ATPase/permease subunit
VDADTEEAILRGLRDVLRGRTTFLISHRVSTVLEADRVVVLDEGGVSESGSPRELLERGGAFARLQQQQRIERELESL